MRTSEEGGGWTANAGVEGCEGVRRILGELVVEDILGRERNWLQIVPEPIRRSVLDS